jgi:hypothetical protein
MQVILQIVDDAPKHTPLNFLLASINVCAPSTIQESFELLNQYLDSYTILNHMLPQKFKSLIR